MSLATYVGLFCRSLCTKVGLLFWTAGLLNVVCVALDELIRVLYVSCHICRL